MQENPDTTPNAMILKDQDSDVLSGYNVVKRIISLFHPITGIVKFSVPYFYEILFLNTIFIYILF
jgi:hypothetical protein